MIVPEVPGAAGVAAAVLAGLTAVRAVEALADVLNLRALRPTPPAGFEDVYDPARYAQAQAYTRARTRFGLAAQAWGFLVLLVFWGTGGFNALDVAVSRHVPTGFSGLAYIGLLALGHDLLSLPFDLYSTFVIEKRFGFNRTTPRTFVLDRAKGYLLAALLGGPLLWTVLWIFSRWGAGAWVAGWAAVTVFSLGLQFIAPTWIMPLFNTFTPLPAGELRTAIFDLARRLDYPLARLFVMDGSRRSAKGNAFFAGFGRNKRIALFDTLIEKHSVPELVAILAHEIGHHKKGHIGKGVALGVAQTGLMFSLLSLALGWPALYGAFGVERMSVAAGLVIFGVLFEPVSFLIGLPLKAFSRHNEFEADRYARESLGSGRDLAAGLRKLSAAGLANLAPHPLHVFLHNTHPPLRERVAALTR